MGDLVAFRHPRSLLQKEHVSISPVTKIYWQSSSRHWLFPYFSQSAVLSMIISIALVSMGLDLFARLSSEETLADLTWEAQSRGWMNYSAWLAKADMVQGPEQILDGLDVDTDTAHGDIGDYVPTFGMAA